MYRRNILLFDNILNMTIESLYISIQSINSFSRRLESFSQINIRLKSAGSRNKNGFLVSIEIRNFVWGFVVFDVTADEDIPPLEKAVMHESTEPRSYLFILKEGYYSTLMYDFYLLLISFSQEVHDFVFANPFNFLDLIRGRLEIFRLKVSLDEETIID
mgnify:CR=1 FL=1